METVMGESIEGRPVPTKSFLELLALVGAEKSVMTLLLEQLVQAGLVDLDRLAAGLETLAREAGQRETVPTQQALQARAQGLRAAIGRA
jgi:hypothetical protein